MNLEIIEKNKELTKVLRNAEYLTHIYVYSNELSLRKIEGKNLSAISVAKVIVQVTYLLYTCSIQRKNVYLLKEPRCKPSPNPSQFHAFLVFFLEDQNSLDNHCKSFEFINLKNSPSAFTSLLIDFLPHLMEKLLKQISPANVEEERLKLKIDTCKNIITNSLLPDFQMNPEADYMLKLQKKCQLFWEHSDLLICFNNFLYYRIKPHQQKLSQLKKFVCKFDEFKKLGKDGTKIFYDVIDQYFDSLIQHKIIKMEKSSSKDVKDNEGLCVGTIQQFEDHEKKFVVEFFTLDQYAESSEFLTEQIIDRDFKNYYQLQIKLNHGIIQVFYITNLEINYESADIIGHHMSNMCFSDHGIIIQQFDTNLKGKESSLKKKNLSFKAIYKLDNFEEPLTQCLFLIDRVTTYAKIFFPLIIKKPGKDYHQRVIQCQNRVNHIKKLVWTKINEKYSNLL